ncbi:MAG: hypothetical protein NVS9B1_15010 [Candidatus Dormibacteraceae bacterium]
MRDRILAVAALVGRGEWTTYGDIARVALGGGGARVVGRLAATSGRFPNAHRVLLAGGRVAPGWGGGQVAECRRRLEAEGVAFDAAGRASPNRFCTWSDLDARFASRVLKKGIEPGGDLGESSPRSEGGAEREYP